jgi:cell division initiation protein
MIDLTPLEVRKKKGDFRRIMRGYDPALVDDFLDLVADRMDELVREVLALTERVGRQEQQVADFRERERALTEALVTAQEMREEIRQQTSREAELVKRSAEQHAGELRSRTEQELERLRSTTEREVAELRASAVQESARLRAAAQQEAAEQRSELRRERERAEQAMHQLSARHEQLLGSYRAFLERELAELAVAERALGLAAGAMAAAGAAAAFAATAAAQESEPPSPRPGESEAAAGVAPVMGPAEPDPQAMMDPNVERGDDIAVEIDDVAIGFDAADALDALDELTGFEPEPLEPFAPEPFEPLDEWAPHDAGAGIDAAPWTPATTRPETGGPGDWPGDAYGDAESPDLTELLDLTEPLEAEPLDQAEPPDLDGPAPDGGAGAAGFDDVWVPAASEDDELVPLVDQELAGLAGTHGPAEADTLDVEADEQHASAFELYDHIAADAADDGVPGPIGLAQEPQEDVVLEESEDEQLLLLRNAAAAGFLLGDDEEDELLLDDAIAEEEAEDGDGWLGTLLEDER